MSEELKPCPFCNGRPRLVAPVWDLLPYCECLRCGVKTTMSMTNAEAIAAWNRRASPTPEGQGDAREVMASAICVNRAPCEACRLSAERALTALQAEGMAVVPMEPSEVMLRDGAARSQDFYTEKGLYPRTQAVWKAMLAASPYGKAVVQEASAKRSGANSNPPQEKDK